VRGKHHPRSGFAAPPRGDNNGGPAKPDPRCSLGNTRAASLPGPIALAAAMAVLAACASQPTGTPDNEPTLAILATRTVQVQPDNGITATPEQAAAAYKRFLDIAPRAPQRAEALRRMGDLAMESADNQSASAGTNPDYRAAITQYQSYLKTYPGDPNNDRVLYQLARAHELGGQLETALTTLDKLVASYPDTAFLDEAQFRRGELLFNTGQYVKSEQAYTSLIKRPAPTPFHDRALYMHGWALYKQGRLDEGLHSFFGVLDLKIAGRSDVPLENLDGLSRGDRELVEDTLRVTSVSLANLRGAESIPAYITNDARRSYEFRVHEQLGELYIKQDRAKDAADAFAAFARRQPAHAQAPVLQARVIGIYEKSGLPSLALGAKKEYVQRYGATSEYRRANSAAWETTAQPLVKAHLAALARHYHAAAQKSKASADVDEAVRWYREILVSFPKDGEASRNQFLLAELLYDDSRFAEAAVEYDKAAYDYPKHDKSADAAYTALLARAQVEKRAAAGDLPALQRTGISGARRFGDRFKGDPRVGPVLTQAAEKLFALKEHEAADQVAQQVLALDPAAAPEQRRVAWTVVSHSAFEAGQFDRAEQGYAQALALMPANAAGRSELVERQAAAIYKQAEQARTAGKAREAVAQFNRVAQSAPQSSVHAAALYDAAATLIGLKDWDGAAQALESFRSSFPKHALAPEAGSKLAAIYLEQKRWGPAAAEFERQAATQTDPRLAAESLWQAAELHDKAGSRDDAARVYAQYAKQYPAPFERHLEARWRLLQAAKDEPKTKAGIARDTATLREIRDADLRAGAARTDRTRTIGGLAALALTQPLLDDYRKVVLVEPLARNLKLKKAKMEAALQAYAQASNSAVPEVVTAATFHTASLYQDFGKALMQSQRPKGLNKAALEQYNVMLEEQAFPFEEKAMELHEANARRTVSGLYDEWIRKSFAALRELRPVRYGKNERSEGAIDVVR
jgi:cellulose synthase operon protein C